MANKEPNENYTPPSLNRIIAEINKKAGENVIGRIPTMGNISVQRLPTGLPGLDAALGGGLPAKRVVELYGLPGVGKSLIALLTIKEIQKHGGECIYLDVEDGFDPEWATKVGVDVDKLVLSQSAVGEDTLEMVAKLLRAEPAIIVVDSVAAMVTRAELEEDIEKAFMAPKARLMSKGLMILNAINKKTLIIFINQLRSTMAMYGPQFTTPGGQALKYYSSIRIEVKKGEDLRVDGKKTTEIIGQTVSYRITKNKVAPPFKNGAFKLWHDGRIEE